MSDEKHVGHGWLAVLIKFSLHRLECAFVFVSQTQSKTCNGCVTTQLIENIENIENIYKVIEKFN